MAKDKVSAIESNGVGRCGMESSVLSLTAQLGE